MSDQAEAYIQKKMGGRRAPPADTSVPDLYAIRPGQPGWSDKLPPPEETIIAENEGGTATPHVDSRFRTMLGETRAPGVADIEAVHRGQPALHNARVVVAYGPRGGTRLVGVERGGRLVARVVLPTRRVEDLLPVLDALASVVDLTDVPPTPE